MNEKTKLNRKLYLHILYNLIGFACIFIICGIIIFIMVKELTYRNVDNSLYSAKTQFLKLETNAEQREGFVDSFFEFDFNRNSDEVNANNGIADQIEENINNILDRRVLNPNVTVIIKDENSQILNSSNLGRMTNYVDEISYNNKKENEIFERIINNKYTYRELDFKYENISIDEDGNEVNTVKYIQLLINVDSEKYLVDSYFKIIITVIVIGIVLSGIASYILSIKTLKPLKENLENQMEFVQNVSHELRTPLTIIQAKQELLLQEPNAKIIDKAEDIGLTLNETQRLSKLVKDLMVLTRGDRKVTNLQKETVNIDEFITNFAANYKELVEMEGKTLELDLHYNIDIQIDTSKIYQVLVILIDNAIKYTEEGDKIIISTFLKDNKCTIEVKDTGIGISDEGLNRIFERFYREDKARSRETGGSGLGLSIADMIITSHNGTIKASHNTPKGTIFTIKLPR